MIWQLFVCAGLSWGGCGFISVSDMPREDCFAALAAIRFDNEADGDTRRSSVVFCRPKPPEPEKTNG